MAPFDGTILDCLTQEHLNELSPHLQLATCSQGQVIVLRGEVLSRFYVLVTGRATAEYWFKRGRPAIELSAGDFFGESAVLEDLACDALVRAGEEGTTALTIELAPFKALLNRNPMLRHRLLDAVAYRRQTLGCAVLGLN